MSVAVQNYEYDEAESGSSRPALSALKHKHYEFRKL